MGPGHAPVVGPTVSVVADAQPVRVVVDAGARLEIETVAFDTMLGTAGLGEAAPAPRADELPEISLVEATEDEPRRLPPFATRWGLDDAGALALDALPPGRWRVWCEYQRFDGERWRRAGFRLRLGTVDLRSGETTKLRVDGTRFRPGRVEGLVTLNGQPYAGGTLYMQFGQADEAGDVQGYGGRTDVPTDALGRFAVDEAQPGRYRVSIRRPDASVLASDWIVLESGGVASIVAACRASRVAVRLRRADGSPAARRRIELDAVDGIGSARGTTDPDGRIAFLICPSGRLDVTVFPEDWEQQQKQIPWQEWKDHEIRLDPIVVAPGTGEQRFELVLPGR